MDGWRINKPTDSDVEALCGFLRGSKGLVLPRSLVNLDFGPKKSGHPIHRRRSYDALAGVNCCWSVHQTLSLVNFHAGDCALHFHDRIQGLGTERPLRVVLEHEHQVERLERGRCRVPRHLS